MSTTPSLWSGIQNIVSDIIPLIMPGEVHVCKSDQLDARTGGETGGMVRMGAIVGVSGRISASVMISKPHTISDIHHHGEQDTIIYSQSGHGTLVSGTDGSKRQTLSPGDFAFVPAWVEHQEVNESDEDVVWIITRSGGTPVVVNLEGWGEGEKV